MNILFSYLRPSYGKMSVGISIKVLGTLVELALPYILSHILKNVVVKEDIGLIVLWGVVMILCAGGALWCNIIANRIAARVACDFSLRMRQDLFDKSIRISAAQTDAITLPSLESRITTDTYNVHSFVSMMLRMGIRAPMLLIGGIAITLLMDSYLALAMLSILPFIFVTVYFISKKGVPLYTKVQRSVDKMIRIVREDVQGIRVIKALSKNDYEHRRYDAANKVLVGDEKRAGTVMSIVNPVMTLLMNVGIVAVVALSASRVANHLSDPEKGAGNDLTDISFAVPRGGSLGIIGATGSGKSTVVRLLQRFYDVGAGSVRINGRDVRTIPRETLSAMFGAAMQNDFLYSDTIEENIRFGRALTHEQIVEAAKTAQADDFITAFPEGYGHLLSQKGTNVSGGQKQRILIARALAARPEILVLDDSSSALDYKTDACLRRALAEKMQGTTIVTVAQRVSSVKDCDVILVLEEGRIIGLGSHEELMKRCSEYREISDSQMGGALVE